ncbi:hypothetical protein E5676_scaffold1493G00620 [Cucumis melo var. makuwa]|uniref:Uncharacterized protein n=1 Tax=Cucumis melo var. makuwa TaxID=1194695 RepID=A0A5D3D6R9_CUCMM|nr:hypothetical protein E6C27_scaffold30G002410 [Cucumis melo var. makuwa]TYK19256.1 hypothetical protein E5676_scaffold1493G00620 [Cucumis melo var. makuwa]
MVITLQETGVLPTHENVKENKKYVGKEYANVFHDVGRTESGEAFLTSYQDGVGMPLPTPSHASIIVASREAFPTNLILMQRTTSVMPLPTFVS